MRIIHRAEEIRNFRKELSEKNKTLGFVPTMGALHGAHLALARQSMQENDATVVSIFVNPTQFNNPEDLEKYPRQVEKDAQQLKEAGVEVVFIPEVEDIYGHLVQSETIDLAGLDQGMEGTHRPGHFAGVATVIKRFFEIIHPNRAYFGEKDYQQLRIIQHMTEQLQFEVEVIGCATQRTEGGLAMSSRNYRLSEEGLEKALIISECLRWAAENYTKYSPNSLKNAVEKRFAGSELELEYVEIANPEDMKPVQHWEDVSTARMFVAAFCEGVRLIDNDKLF